MTRQKVKGTGHKQPADAKTEPNFYEMSSLSSRAQQVRRTTSLNNTTASLPPHPLPSSSNSPLISVHRDIHRIDFLNESTRQLQPHQLQYDRHNRAAMNPVSVEISNSSVPAESVLDSPGLQCAAHLLQGIASGYIKNNLHIPTSDALSTGGLEDETEKELLPFERSSDESGNRRSTSFLQPRMSNEYR
jgi:hypothetical protein